MVQLYVKAPLGVVKDKPEKELRAFTKTQTLDPGQKVTVRLTVPKQDLASFDEDSKTWVVEKGDYEFMTGASSQDIRRSVVVTM